jgi:hypothetical protein
MQFHPSDPRDAAFKAELDKLSPNISTDLGDIATRPEQVGEQILEAILRRGCQAQHTRNIVLGRLAAAEVPRDWFVARVETVAARVLNLEDEWEYRRYLELCGELDAGLLQRLVARGLVSDNAEIREAAEDFHDRDNVA